MESVQDGQKLDEAVPQFLPDHCITFSELAIATKVLEAVATFNKARKRKTGDHEDVGMESYKHKNLRPFRKALASCLELHQRSMFDGKEEAEYFEARKQQRSLKRMKMAERDLQKKRIAATALRQGRIDKMKKLQEDGRTEEEARLLQANMIPDGHVETQPQGLIENGETEQTLPKLRSCYVCKDRYRTLHHFYDQLCPVCAALNWEKRHQTCDLTDKVAVVTGARVKIGLQTCLKLLRAGCTVVATTRFPNAAADTYKRQDGFAEWGHNLHLYGLDLRDVSGLEAFTRFLKLQYGKQGIDILINNACQTVRRPAGYFSPAVEKEQELWANADRDHKKLLQGCTEFERLRRQVLGNQRQPASIAGTSLPAVMPQDNEQDDSAIISKADSMVSPFDTCGLSHSAAMSQMVILPEDAGVSDDILPRGLSDINGQQLDLRTSNSWILKMEEVSTPEVLECMFVNAIAPFVLNSRLKPLMTVPGGASRPDRYIVNVSAMEGKFYRYKMPNHPHTNMAKAALNMLTRTSAEDLSKNHRIHMNSVDTGWINDENPLQKASRIATDNMFQTPIDEIDAASRILDPIFVGVDMSRKDKNFKHDFGKFLKDYRESEW